MHCDCSRDDFDEWLGFGAAYVRAGKRHECIECGAAIPRGSRFELIRAIDSDSCPRIYKTCLPCARIRNHYCAGGFIIGGLAAQIEPCIGWDYREDPPDEDDPAFDGDVKLRGEVMMMKSDERHEREMDYRNRGYSRLQARDAVLRDDILRGARRCRDGWREARAQWRYELTEEVELGNAEHVRLEQYIDENDRLRRELSAANEATQSAHADCRALAEHVSCMTSRADRAIVGEANAIARAEEAERQYVELKTAMGIVGGTHDDARWTARKLAQTLQDHLAVRARMGIDLSGANAKADAMQLQLNEVAIERDESDTCRRLVEHDRDAAIARAEEAERLGAELAERVRAFCRKVGWTTGDADEFRAVSAACDVIEAVESMRARVKP